MGPFDHLFTQGKKAAEPVPQSVPIPETASPATAKTIPEGPIPPVKQIPTADGKGEYQAFSAPKYERREWFFIWPRSLSSHMATPEMLRYDLLYRIAFSPDGSNFALIYVDQVYLIRGKYLHQAVWNIADRYLDLLQEYDPTSYYVITDDRPIITSIQSFKRNDPNLPDWTKQVSENSQ
jgi:hypothetical protein